MDRIGSLIIAGGIALAASGCAMSTYPAATAGPSSVEVATNPNPPVPAPRVEMVPPAPSATVAWEPGHWEWNGASYDWRAGGYVARAAVTGTRWVEGHWEGQGGGWVWVGGHWA